MNKNVKNKTKKKKEKPKNTIKIKCKRKKERKTKTNEYLLKTEKTTNPANPKTQNLTGGAIPSQSPRRTMRPQI